MSEHNDLARSNNDDGSHTRMTDQFRIIGRLEGQMESAEERLDRIETKLDVLTEYVQQQKGGVKVVWAIAGAGGVIGASLTKLIGMIAAALRSTT